MYNKTMWIPRILFLFLVTLLSCSKVSKEKKFVENIVNAHGGKEKFYAFRNVCLRQTNQYPVGKAGQAYQEYYNLFDETVERGLKLENEAYYNKRNFFLFSFPFKLLDPGSLHSNMRKESVGGHAYDAVTVSNDGVSYQVYVQPKTHLIEYVKFEKDEAVAYSPVWIKFYLEQINGLWLGVRREFFRVSTEGELFKKPDREETLRDIIFWCRDS